MAAAAVEPSHIFSRVMAVLTWVSDKLHDILGISDKFTAEFLIGLAKKSTTEDAFLEKLKSTGAIAINDSVTAFAAELWGRVPHDNKKDPYKANREREKAAYLQQQKNKSYRLLLEDDDTVESRATKRSSLKRKDKEENSKKKKRKEKAEKSSSVSGKDERHISGKKKRNLRKEKAVAWESESESEEERENFSAAKRTKADSDSDEWEK